MGVLHVLGAPAAQRPRQRVLRNIGVRSCGVNREDDRLDTVRPNLGVGFKLEENDQCHAPTLRQPATRRIPEIVRLRGQRETGRRRYAR